MSKRVIELFLNKIMPEQKSVNNPSKTKNQKHCSPEMIPKNQESSSSQQSQSSSRSPSPLPPQQIKKPFSIQKGNLVYSYMEFITSKKLIIFFFLILSLLSLSLFSLSFQGKPKCPQYATCNGDQVDCIPGYSLLAKSSSFCTNSTLSEEEITNLHGFAAYIYKDQGYDTVQKITEEILKEYKSRNFDTSICYDDVRAALAFNDELLVLEDGHIQRPFKNLSIFRITTLFLFVLFFSPIFYFIIIWIFDLQ